MSACQHGSLHGGREIMPCRSIQSQGKRTQHGTAIGVARGWFPRCKFQEYQKVHVVALSQKKGFLLLCTGCRVTHNNNISAAQFTIFSTEAIFHPIRESVSYPVCIFPSALAMSSLKSSWQRCVLNMNALLYSLGIYFRLLYR